MLKNVHAKFVRFFPQPHAVNFANTLLESSPIDLNTINEQSLWKAITSRNWTKFDEIARNIKHDEITYTLILNGYLLSHHHASSAALLVIDAMKQQDMHAAIVRFNERMTLSHMEIAELGIRPSSHSYQNIVRLGWMTAAKLRKSKLSRVGKLLTERKLDTLFSTSKKQLLSIADNENKEAHMLVSDEYNDKHSK